MTSPLMPVVDNIVVDKKSKLHLLCCELQFHNSEDTRVRTLHSATHTSNSLALSAPPSYQIISVEYAQ